MRAIGLLLAAALFALGGCAPTMQYVAARNVETGAAAFVNTGADIWHAYSHAKLENCKDAVQDFQSFMQCANDWEENGVKVGDKVIVAARDTVHDFDTSLAAVDATKAKDYSAGIAKVIAAVTEMVNVLTGLGVKMPAFKVQ